MDQGENIKGCRIQKTPGTPVAYERDCPIGCAIFPAGLSRPSPGARFDFLKSNSCISWGRLRAIGGTHGECG